MTATLKTTVIQEPSSATANLTLSTSGGVTVGQNLTVTGGLTASGTVSGITGRVIRSPQYLTSGTSYTTPANCTSILVEAWGGGGGGGGVTAASASGRGGGGGSGAYAVRTFTVSPSTSYVYSIGSGGAGGTTAPTAGGNGGGTSITVSGVTFTAGGGLGGAFGASSVGGAGGAGGTSTNADFSFSFSGRSGVASGISGSGAGSPMWGNFGIGHNANLPGLDAFGYGSGGAGGGSGTTGQAGGAGFQGIIKITEFA